MENKKELNKKIIKIRVKLQKEKIKKSGKSKQKNSYGKEIVKFEYFELQDFLPKLNELMGEEEVNDIFSIKDDKAILKLVFEEEEEIYEIPFILFETPTFKTGKMMQDIQYLGALNTYYKRYLYMNAFGITDGEIIDSLDNSKMDTKKNTKIKPNSGLAKVQEEYKKKYKELNEEQKEEIKIKLSSNSNVDEIKKGIEEIDNLKKDKKNEMIEDF